MPFDLEWGVSKRDKLAAVTDLFKALSHKKTLADVFNTHEKALSQGVLGDIYSLLKSLEQHEHELEPNYFKLTH